MTEKSQQNGTRYEAERLIPQLHYTRELLEQKEQQGRTMDFVFFWHEPKPAEPLSAGCFSQWYLRPFHIDGQEYCCCEQYMMAEKARVFGDDEVLALIMKATAPRAIKKLGKQVRGFKPAVWDQVKRTVVMNANLAKFSQNADLKALLLVTDDKILAEASPKDAIWGIGLGAEDEAARHPRLWKGSNLLGFALMEVRRVLRSGAI